VSNPGRGINNVLWVTDPWGREFHQLTELSTSDASSGVLHPQFSPDGSRLAWSEIYEGATETGTLYGHWRLVLADFVVGPDGRPGVQNVQKIELGDPAFYETHGFSPDGSRLLFSSNVARTDYLQSINNDIFLLDLGTSVLERLTDQHYNEHAHFFPNGGKIAWMTNTDINTRGTELWIMNADGSGKARLTFFNQQGCPEYAGVRMTVADNTINAAGDKLLAFTHNQITDYGSIMLVELDRQP
jgi:Tol biopolymer transport system component